jgi:hypothetical protein
MGKAGSEMDGSSIGMLRMTAFILAYRDRRGRLSLQVLWSGMVEPLQLQMTFICCWQCCHFFSPHPQEVEVPGLVGGSTCKHQALLALRRGMNTCCVRRF